LIRQVKYYGIPAMLMIILTFIVLVILWGALLPHNVIGVTWTSMTYEPNLHKSERAFLFSLVTLVAPVLRFHDLTVYDLIVSVVAILLGIVGFVVNEHRLNRKKQKA
ncbi:hypothetical protein IAG15_19485, partial [Enterococcus faecalis]|nr:hypothetical protein [Enterococcus faecalis]